mmetsp:Transcript_44214/g.120457  ORF Transcript_44214/g.120457 Transcript_44214/m.120457 type:complete len:227 (+) Transcript_44214:955-1635(+)
MLLAKQARALGGLRRVLLPKHCHRAGGGDQHVQGPQGRIGAEGAVFLRRGRGRGGWTVLLLRLEGELDVRAAHGPLLEGGVGELPGGRACAPQAQLVGGAHPVRDGRGFVKRRRRAGLAARGAHAPGGHHEESGQRARALILVRIEPRGRGGGQEGGQRDHACGGGAHIVRRERSKHLQQGRLRFNVMDRGSSTERKRGLSRSARAFLRAVHGRFFLVWYSYSPAC